MRIENDSKVFKKPGKIKCDNQCTCDVPKRVIIVKAMIK